MISRLQLNRDSLISSRIIKLDLLQQLGQISQYMTNKNASYKITLGESLNKNQ